MSLFSFFLFADEFIPDVSLVMVPIGAVLTKFLYPDQVAQFSIWGFVIFMVILIIASLPLGFFVRYLLAKIRKIAKKRKKRKK